MPHSRIPSASSGSGNGLTQVKGYNRWYYLDFIVEIIRRSDEAKGFEVLPRRWVVERTFGWMTRWRRLVRDSERRVDMSQAMIFVAMGANLMRRNAHT
ncbi:hypothetical protein HK19_00435 [Acetobacter persici]|nr:hypothetical protein HK19_00435 [Acetobacter persici]